MKVHEGKQSTGHVPVMFPSSHTLTHASRCAAARPALHCRDSVFTARGQIAWPGGFAEEGGGAVLVSIPLRQWS